MRLTYELSRPDTRDLTAMINRCGLVPAGAPGGPAWTDDQQERLLASPESHWPTGQLVAWAPTGHRWERRHLLDGHRRAATVAGLTAAGEEGLLRDLTADEPRYLPAGRRSDDGVYLPAAAMLSTMRFLPATRCLPKVTVEQAWRCAAALMHARLDLVTLFGGTPDDVASLCERLVGGRVDPAVLQAITARVHHSDPSGPGRLP